MLCGKIVDDRPFVIDEVVERRITHAVVTNAPRELADASQIKEE